MNFSSENFESTFNSFENFNNINSQPLTENFSWIKPREPKVFCDGLYCGIPQEKAFAKYENRNYTKVTSKYGFNAPSFNERRSMKFKSLATQLQKLEYPKDKRGFTAVSAPSDFSDFEPIQGLYRDITLDGAIKAKKMGKSIANVSSENVSSPKLSSSEYNDFRKNTNLPTIKFSQRSKIVPVNQSSATVSSSKAPSIVTSKTPSSKISVSIPPTSSVKVSSAVPTSSVKVSSSVPTSSVKVSSAVPTSSVKVSSAVPTSSAKSTSSSSVPTSTTKSSK
jgi:hypothetical protein